MGLVLLPTWPCSMPKWESGRLSFRVTPLGGDEESLAKVRSVFAIADAFSAAEGGEDEQGPRGAVAGIYLPGAAATVSRTAGAALLGHGDIQLRLGAVSANAAAAWPVRPRTPGVRWFDSMPCGRSFEREPGSTSTETPTSGMRACPRLCETASSRPNRSGTPAMGGWSCSIWQPSPNVRDPPTSRTCCAFWRPGRVEPSMS